MILIKGNVQGGTILLEKKSPPYFEATENAQFKRVSAFTWDDWLSFIVVTFGFSSHVVLSFTIREPHGTSWTWSTLAFFVNVCSSRRNITIVPTDWFMKSTLLPVWCACTSQMPLPLLLSGSVCWSLDVHYAGWKKFNENTSCFSFWMLQYQ